MEKKLITKLLFHLLLAKLFRLSIAEQSRIISTDNRMLSYFKNFQTLVGQHIKTPKTIQQYAKSLNITPVHLNRICQALVQKPALQIVHEKIIAEARNYLLYTNDRVADIAYNLNFKEPSNFSKFFKKMVGISPRKFRQRNDSSLFS